MEEETTVGGQLKIVRKWTNYMQECANKETLSSEETSEVQAVYDLMKQAIY